MVFTKACLYMSGMVRLMIFLTDLCYRRRSEILLPIAPHIGRQLCNRHDYNHTSGFPKIELCALHIALWLERRNCRCSFLSLLSFITLA